MHFPVYGFKVLCEISMVPIEILHKILNTYAAKYAFYDDLCNLRVMTSYVLVRWPFVYHGAM